MAQDDGKKYSLPKKAAKPLKNSKDDGDNKPESPKKEMTEDKEEPADNKPTAKAFIKSNDPKFKNKPREDPKATYHMGDANDPTGTKNKQITKQEYEQWKQKTGQEPKVKNKFPSRKSTNGKD